MDGSQGRKAVQQIRKGGCTRDTQLRLCIPGATKKIKNLKQTIHSAPDIGDIKEECQLAVAYGAGYIECFADGNITEKVGKIAGYVAGTKTKISCMIYANPNESIDAVAFKTMVAARAGADLIRINYVAGHLENVICQYLSGMLTRVSQSAKKFGKKSKLPCAYDWTIPRPLTPNISLRYARSQGSTISRSIRGLSS